MGSRARVKAVAALALIGAVLFPMAAAQAQVESSRATISGALNVSALQPGKSALLAIPVEIAPGFHAQSHAPLDKNLIPFTVQMTENPHVRFGEPVYPPGEVHNYPALGAVSQYVGKIVIFVPVEVKSDAPPGSIELAGSANYQICDDSTCFPPEDSSFSVSSNVVAASEAVKPNQPELFADYRPAAAAAPLAATSQPATAPTAGAMIPGDSDSKSLLWALGTALLAGLIFNVMPCVLPVMPIKAMSFYEVSQHRRGKCVLLGVVFSLGLIAVFAILGLCVLVLRKFTWGEMYSNPFFVWTIVTMLVLMALWLFGAFTTSLPGFVYAYSPRHDTYTGNFLLGGFTAIVATPCTAPLLPPLLLWAASRPGYIGVPAVAFVGVGMALPYLVLSAFPELARRFPRTGPWPELFKQMMGFMVLAAAAVFAGGQLIEGVNFWWATVPVVAIAAIYLVARTVQLSKGALAVGVSSTLAVLMLGVTLGWTAKVTGLLERPTATGSGATAAHHFTPYTPDAFDAARAAGKTVLVKFTANWCLTCQYIEGSVFRDDHVWEALDHDGVVVMKVDLTRPNPDGSKLLRTLNPAGGIPLTAIWSQSHDKPIVLASVYTSSELLDALAKVKSNGTNVASSGR
jgi:thiol:disulfide interchange protein DsbD